MSMFGGLDKNRQSDTMKLEFFRKEDDVARSKDEGVSFIGECFVPFKLCFESEN